jgi:RNA polymerase sigma-70 factor (ECF subfamily)
MYDATDHRVSCEKLLDSMEEESDKIFQRICEVALSDSQSAFKSIYFHYHEKMIRFIRLYISSKEETEEILSDIFIALWQNRKNLTEVSNFNSYIYKIAYNKIISSYRKQYKEKENLDVSHIDLFLQTETTPEIDLITKENITLLNSAVNALPDKCKLIFKLIREDKLKYKEAAEIMNISVKTVETHLATAIRKLRETLEKQFIP